MPYLPTVAPPPPVTILRLVAEWNLLLVTKLMPRLKERLYEPLIMERPSLITALKLIAILRIATSIKITEPRIINGHVARLQQVKFMMSMTPRLALRNIAK